MTLRLCDFCTGNEMNNWQFWITNIRFRRHNTFHLRRIPLSSLHVHSSDIASFFREFSYFFWFHVQTFKLKAHSVNGNYVFSWVFLLHKRDNSLWMKDFGHIQTLWRSFIDPFLDICNSLPNIFYPRRKGLGGCETFPAPAIKNFVFEKTILYIFNFIVSDILFKHLGPFTNRIPHCFEKFLISPCFLGQ